MKTTKLFLLLAVALLFISCKDTKYKNYNPDTFTQDVDEMLKNEEVDTLAISGLKLYVMIQAMQGKESGLVKYTYQELLDKSDLGTMMTQMNDEKLVQELNQKFEDEARTKRLANWLKADMIDIGMAEIDYVDNLTYDVMYKNTSAKDTINAVRGDFMIYDQFGVNVAQIKIRETAFLLAPGKSLTTQYYVEYNKYNSDDNTVYATDISKLKIQWVPIELHTTDGIVLK